jgi:alkanesulfonate monooxygenase SsuD/methylene tetrahydromethanopterin reductase-like flavin-dependent oxidoreductase (luciferase family)
MMNPVPAQPVPILIGGISRPALRRAARMGDGWIGPGQSPQAAMDTLQELEKLRREYGTFNRDFNIVVPLFGENITVDDIKRLRDAGATGMVSLPFNFVIGPGTTLQQKQDHLHWYADNIIAKVNH